MTRNCFCVVFQFQFSPKFICLSRSSLNARYKTNIFHVSTFQHVWISSLDILISFIVDKLRNMNLVLSSWILDIHKGKAVSKLALLCSIAIWYTHLLWVQNPILILTNTRDCINLHLPPIYFDIWGPLFMNHKYGALSSGKLYPLLVTPSNKVSTVTANCVRTYNISTFIFYLFILLKAFRY